jgi:hypothetical protein
VKEYLVTNDWATQDSLVPVIGTVLGFSAGEVGAIKVGLYKLKSFIPIA